MVFFLLSYVVERASDSGGDLTLGDDWMTMYEKHVMELVAGNLRKRLVAMIVQQEIGNSTEAKAIAEAYDDGMTADDWAEAIQTRRAETLTPEQMEMLIEILKIVLQILILLG